MQPEGTHTGPPANGSRGRSLRASCGRTVGGLVIVAAASISVWGCREESVPRVTIGQTTWTVELATTSEQGMQGLAGRPRLAEGTGMLFVFPRAQVRNFWMRGCLIPLDIAFIGPDLRVVKTHTMAVEPDRAGRVIYSSEVAAQYALEVPAGSLAAAGVAIGDRVTFSGPIGAAAKAQPGP